MQDRIPLHPGRVTLTPVAGQANTYDMARADSPTQEGTPLNKASLLSDAVCEILGLEDTATPNDAFMALCLPSGKYAISVTVKSPAGRPIQGVTLSGLLTAAGNPVVTNNNGVGFGFSTTSPSTITADISAFLDLTGAASVTITPTAGVVNRVEINCSRSSSSQTTLSTSRIVRFSPDVDEYDWSAIGGGENGSIGSQTASSIEARAYGGRGGNAGGVLNKANVKNTGATIPVIIGSAGGGISSVAGSETGAGAVGGVGGSTNYNSDTDKVSLTNAAVGGDTENFLYPQTEVGGAGGGGAAVDESSGKKGAGANGGLPGGGAGAKSITSNGSDGTLPGSGGGGGAASAQLTIYGTGRTTLGGAGKSGLVGFRWRYIS